LDLIDTGCGMDQQTLIHMFDAFYSTKYGGSGLGLPTAKKVIEAHHGKIYVQSAVDRGTQITLEFPTPARLGADPDASPSQRVEKAMGENSDTQHVDPETTEDDDGSEDDL
jgi:hypothetical protein